MGKILNKKNKYKKNYYILYIIYIMKVEEVLIIVEKTQQKKNVKILLMT